MNGTNIVYIHWRIRINTTHCWCFYKNFSLLTWAWWRLGKLGLQSPSLLSVNLPLTIGSILFRCPIDLYRTCLLMWTAHLIKFVFRLHPRQIIFYLKHVCHIPPTLLITTKKSAGININFIADNFLSSLLLDPWHLSSSSVFVIYIYIFLLSVKCQNFPHSIFNYFCSHV